MSQKKTADLLIASASARPFAASAQRAGYAAVVIDGFCDTDTQQYSTACYTSPLGAACTFDSATFQKVFTQCLQDHPTLSAWVIGSGFESCPDILTDLSQSLPLLGNTPQVLRLCAQRCELRDRAQRLGIACPPDLATLPRLYKKSGSNGGQHIRFAPDTAEHSVRENYLAGNAISHLFFADGNDIQSVGISTQWQARHQPEQPFCYGGSLNRCLLHDTQGAQLEEWSRRLACDLGLRGLNNIDYLHSAGQLYFLELNPRLSASFPLYDRHVCPSLLDAHIRVCRGGLSALPELEDDGIVRAQAVIYAQADTQLPNDFEWGEGVHDRPSKRAFAKGEPICSVSAQGDSVASALDALQEVVRQAPA